MIGDRFRLDGRTVVVAGAWGGGVGTAVCVGAAGLGATVVGIDVADGSLADELSAPVGRRRARPPAQLGVEARAIAESGERQSVDTSRCSISHSSPTGTKRSR